MRRAKRLWNFGLQGVKPEMEALCAEEPFAPEELQKEWRRRLLARDPGGEFRLAQAAAQEALDRAQSADETYEALTWLAIIECDRGLHKKELLHAQLLIQLRPQSDASWGAVRRAARCNDLPLLREKADQRLGELEPNAIPKGMDPARLPRP